MSGIFSLVGEPTMSVDGCIYFCRDRRKTYAALHVGGWVFIFELLLLLMPVVLAGIISNYYM